MTYTTPCVTPVHRIVVEGEIDAAAVISVQRRIGDVLDAGHDRVVVDLGAVTVLGGQTLSVFCRALRRVNRRGTRLTIVGAKPVVRRVLERCAIDGVELYATLGAAVAAAGPTGRPAAAPRPAVLAP